MTTMALDRGGVWRWLASGVVVLSLHAAAVAALVARPVPIEPGANSDTIMVDFAPLGNAAIDSPADATPGPQQQVEQPAPEPPKAEEMPEEKTEVPPAPVPPIAALPQVEPVKPEPQMQTPPVETTAPPRQRTASNAEITSWHIKIVAQIEHHKAYPRAAQARGEKGVVRLTFKIDRHGRLTSSRILASSGYPVLDQEGMATLRRAQPFASPPPDLPGEEFDFNVPVNFNIR